MSQLLLLAPVCKWIHFFSCYFVFCPFNSQASVIKLKRVQKKKQHLRDFWNMLLWRREGAMKLEGHQRGTVMKDLIASIKLLGSLILWNKLDMGTGFFSCGGARFSHFIFNSIFIFLSRLHWSKSLTLKMFKNLNYETLFPLGIYSPDVYPAKRIPLCLILK